ncbi:MAG TPA: hypothetical protein PK683_16755, partial [Leptospiraceae bacterium]|nr:hypothetical protein [Leptospiraceae bacterium]
NAFSADRKTKDRRGICLTLSLFYMLFFVFLNLNCRNQEEILLERLNLPGSSDFRKLYSAEKQSSSGKETVHIFQGKNEEHLVVSRTAEDGPHPVFVKTFLHSFYGPYSYSQEKGKWIPDSGKECPCILIQTELKKIGEDSYESLFLKVLSEEPPFGLSAVPFVIRENKVILNGLDMIPEDSKIREEGDYLLELEKDGNILIRSQKNTSKLMLGFKNGTYVRK